MSKTFRPWEVDQAWLLPPSVHDFVPAGHPAHLVREIVREELELGAILSTYEEPRGYPPFHPGMMTALLLYSYAQGVYSSRRIAKACEERVDVMAVTGLARPDFRTINAFRKRHLAALADLFVQVLALCRQAGLVKLGHVALDGSKIKANASKHKAMSYGRMVKAEAELAAEVDGWLKAAEAQDRVEDAEHGAGSRGDELPAWVADKAQRLAKIRAAKAALEAEAKAAAEAKDAAPKRDRGGRKPQHPPGQPKPQAQRNFTDADSCIMVGKDGFIQAYNAQIAVDAKAQIILAHRLAGTPSDQAAVVPLVDAVKAHAGARPREVSADAGFCSEATLAAMAERRIKTYFATGRPRILPAARRSAAGLWSPPCGTSCAGPDAAAAIACASRWSSPSSARSSRPAASANSCCAAATRSPMNGRCSAPPTTSPSSAGPDRLEQAPAAPPTRAPSHRRTPTPDHADAPYHRPLRLPPNIGLTWTAS